MHAVDERLMAWAAQATRAERRAGPTVRDLGGAQQVEAAADHLAHGPFLPYLVSATAHHIVDVGAENAAPLCTAILDGLRTQTSHAAFTGATDALTAHPALARALGSPLIRVLINRLTAAQDAGDDLTVALIGAEAADCLLNLHLAGITSAARLLGALDEVTEDAAALPTPFAARLPRLLGVLAAHHPTAGLRDALERCLPLDHTCRDAAFELAMADLRQALQQDGYAAMAAQLRNVHRRLAELLTIDPDRLDARLYHAAIDAVLALPAADAPTKVHNAATTLHTTLHKYRAWRRRTTTAAWARSRTDDITAWAELTVVLQAAAAHLGRNDPWYNHGHDILTALLRAYAADNTLTVLTATPTAAAVTTMVAPVIEDAFLQQQHRLGFLRHALEHDEQLRNDPATRHLHSVLTRRMQTSDEPTTPGSDPGKARRWHRLAHCIPESFTDLVETMPEDALDRLEVALRTHEDVLATISDPKYSRLKEQLIIQLEKSRDWLTGIAEPFLALLDATIRYAYYCYDIGRQTGGSFTEFLRLRDKDGKKQKVDEALFHQHYREVIAFSALYQVVHSEVIDKANGRTDVLFTFGAIQFNVECKIEEDDASEEGLRKYVAQAVEYQNTNAAFAILLALDKTVRAEGAINFFDSIWIEPVQRKGERDPCNVVIVRIPGGRENPNQLRLSQ